MGNEVTKETPQKVELGLKSELFSVFFFFSSSSSFVVTVIALLASKSWQKWHKAWLLYIYTYEEMRIEIRPDAIHSLN